MTAARATAVIDDVGGGRCRGNEPSSRVSSQTGIFAIVLEPENNRIRLEGTGRLNGNFESMFGRFG